MSEKLLAKNLQTIPLTDGRYLLKRGIHEVIIGGGSSREIVESLVEMLQNARSKAEILDAFSADVRVDVQLLLDVLVRRGLANDSSIQETLSSATDDLQAAFYANFGTAGQGVPERLRRATVLVVGINQIGNKLIQQLLECGIGKIISVDHPILRNHVDPRGGTLESSGTAGWVTFERLHRLDSMPDDLEFEDVSLICATSDLGLPQALSEINRLALRMNKPYLPVWLEDMLGSVGPLCFPYETACLRCFLLRSDANDARWQITRAKRKFAVENPDAGRMGGYLPPIPGVLGEVAAMEIVKCLGEFVPSDSIGRIIQMNLVSHGFVVRRVLKVPRCPDCGEKTRIASTAVLRGPQIAQRD